MKGRFVGFEPELVDGHLKLWVDMIAMSIKHARKEELTELTPSLRQRECYEARCYLLSCQFEQDSEWIGIMDEAIGKARTCWEYQTDKSRCAVCGRKEARGLYACGRKVCWEHFKIIEAYNNGYDLDAVMKEIARKAKEPKQAELVEFKPEFTGCIRRKLTDNDKQIIRESYAKGRKARWLAVRFNVTMRTIHMVVAQTSQIL